MIKHLFKLIWNKKKENFLLISEILVSFLVIFAVFTLSVNYYQHYKQPKGFDDENVWAAHFSSEGDYKKVDSVAQAHEALKNALVSLPKVKTLSFTSDNGPFSDNTSSDSFKYLNANCILQRHAVESDYAKVLRLTMVRGRWFLPEDKLTTPQNVVINVAAAEKLIGNTDAAIGKVINSLTKFKIVGVINNVKDKSDFKEALPGIYTLIDTGDISFSNLMLIKVAPDADAGFEGKLFKQIANITKSPSIQIKHLPEMRVAKNKETIIPMVIMMVVSGFLIFNVALGLFGVLWYNISKRRGEIGLRRAIGASAFNVSAQLVGEALVLTTFSLIIGTFFAIQFPLLHVFDLSASIYLTALLLSILFIYLLVIICALYPGKQAASIHPAVALHED